jgi:GTPase SAR1 family protein
MAWSWGSFVDAVKKLAQVIAAVPAIKDFVTMLAEGVQGALKWWDGRKIAVLGPTAVGKNSLYSRLRDEAVPTEHVNTRGAENVAEFKFERTLPNGKIFSIKCKRSVNVGGETDERDRYWLDACSDADVIFYMVDLPSLRKSPFDEDGRIREDLRWLAANMGKMKPTALVHILVNKIDIAIDKEGNYKALESQLRPSLTMLEDSAKHLLGPFGNRVTGVTPTSMVNKYLFEISFASALEAVHKAVAT